MGIGTLLQAIGKTREATLLKNAYTAFSVYNTPRYDRSILSAVDNAVALRVSTAAVVGFASLGLACLSAAADDAAGLGLPCCQLDVCC
jgi:hypothetical protein